MNNQLMLRDAINICSQLFSRNKVSGSSANMSFKCNDDIYITASGSCFGNLAENDFVKITGGNQYPIEISPSKEAPIHFSLYKYWTDVHAIIHTHSFYSTLWSCLPHSDHDDLIPAYTPYLRMKLGKVGLVPYAHPGTKELFHLFDQHASKGKGFILQNHGVVVAAENLLEAFYILEELEENLRIAWHLRNEDLAKVIPNPEELENVHKKVK